MYPIKRSNSISEIFRNSYQYEVTKQIKYVNNKTFIGNLFSSLQFHFQD